jgi:hypothetical protein
MCAKPANPSLHLMFASRLRRLVPAGELKRQAVATIDMSIE